MAQSCRNEAVILVIRANYSFLGCVNHMGSVRIMVPLLGTIVENGGRKEKMKRKPELETMASKVEWDQRLLQVILSCARWKHLYVIWMFFAMRVPSIV